MHLQLCKCIFKLCISSASSSSSSTLQTASLRSVRSNIYISTIVCLLIVCLGFSFVYLPYITTMTQPQIPSSLSSSNTFQTPSVFFSLYIFPTCFSYSVFVPQCQIFVLLPLFLFPFPLCFYIFFVLLYPRHRCSRLLFFNSVATVVHCPSSFSLVIPLLTRYRRISIINQPTSDMAIEDYFATKGDSSPFYSPLSVFFN